MKVLVAACCPGAAEGLAPAVALLIQGGHPVTLIGVDNRKQANQRFGGSGGIFEHYQLPYFDLQALIETPTPDQVSNEAVARLMRSCNPDGIVVGTCRDPSGSAKGIEETLVVLGGSYGIPVVQFVDSWEVWYPKRYEGYTASTYLVPDDMTRQVVHRRGHVALDLIRVTGNPAWEHLITASQLDRVAIRQQLGIGPQHRFLIYFGDVTADDPTTLYWTLRYRAPMDRVLFRRHPRDVRDYSQLMADYPEAFIQVEWTSDALLFCADVCLTHHGAMGVKAALAGIPTINFILAGDCDELCRLCGGFPLSLLGGSYQVCSERAYQQVIARVVPPNAQELKRKLRLDGQASLRIVKALQDVADGQRSTDD